MSANESNVWDNPDPRIKWAFDILDTEGYETASILGHYMFPTLMAGVVFGGRLMRNYILRRPGLTGFPLTVAMMAASGYVGLTTREYLAKKNQEEVAILKHYMMLHPERFPEPEAKKFGDKCVVLEWPRMR